MKSLKLIYVKSIFHKFCTNDEFNSKAITVVGAKMYQI